jgi:polygalacturonase
MGRQPIPKTVIQAHIDTIGLTTYFSTRQPLKYFCFEENVRLDTTRLLVVTALAAGITAWPLLAQDTRHVEEPRVPRVCAALRADLAAPGGRLSGGNERRLDTARIQSALDRCPAGQAVELRSTGSGNEREPAHGRGGARDVFLTGPIQLRAGVALLIDRGVALFASRDPRLYDVTPGSCGVVNEKGHGCKPLILAEDSPGSAVMGDGAIDGRGGETLLGQSATWWDLAHQAKLEDRAQSCFRLLVVRHSDGFILYRITLRNSPNFHVSVERTNGFTAWGVKIDTPRTARNTDGIDPSSSTNVSILHSWIRAGDDDAAIKAGSAGPSTHITVADDRFYSGHGMSIGSETNGGVSAVRVEDLTIDGADNGIRIKSDRSRGGVVEDVSYENVCMRDVKNPILFTPVYTTHAGDLLPVYRNIKLRDVAIAGGGRFTLDGLDADHPLSATLDNVFADGLEPANVRASFANIVLGPRMGNLLPAGDGVSVTPAAGSHAGTPLDCAGRFVPFPVDDVNPASAENVPPIDKTLYVAADGTGDFFSIQQAVNAAPNDGATIRIARGTYREFVSIDKPNMRLIGSGNDPSRTVIVFDRSAGTSGGTLHSATVNVTGDSFIAENLTIQNDWNATHPQLPAGSQALALLVTGDKAVFRNVRLLGNQDTLYAGSRNCSPDGEPCTPARQYFAQCFIAGNVDFIFGDGKAVFDRCEIHSTEHNGGFITAQAKHYPAEDSGFVFTHCRLTADPDVTGVYLGRPWRPYATVIFLDTEMGAFLSPAGWREWHPGETQSLATAYYAEYHSTGQGARPQDREPQSHQLTDAEAAQYATTTFLDGWNPDAEGKP